MLTSIKIARANLALACLLVGLVGCQSDEPVAEYEVPQESSSPVASTAASSSGETGGTEEGSDRMLAAMVAEGRSVWFFKATGPTSQLEGQVAAFQAFLQSLSFAEGKPEWTLPEGWRAEPGSGMRFATLVMGDAALRMSVIPLSAPQDVADNVNRWRGQMSLPALEGEALAETVSTVAFNGGEAQMVDLRGTTSLSGGMAPFMNRDPAKPKMPSSAPNASATDATSRPQTPSPGLRFDVPDGWESGRTGGMRLAAFNASEVEITVTTLGRAGSELLPNINRWRRQVGLAPFGADELEDVTEPITVDGLAGTWVQLRPEASGETTQSINAVIVLRREKGWFFKMMGPAEAVAAQTAAFREFIASVQFQDGNE